MANKTILLADKQIVIQRLAEGKSTRQAIKGTEIASNQTAARIAKAESHRITQIRKEYVSKIENSSARIQNRAEMLMAMLYADQPFRLGSVTERCHHIRIDGNENTFVYVPDWDTRLKAIKYMDQLSGLMPVQGGTHINMLQQVNEHS